MSLLTNLNRQNQNSLDIETKIMINAILNLKNKYQSQLIFHLAQNNKKVDEEALNNSLTKNFFLVFINFGNIFSLAIYQIVKDYNEHISYLYNEITKSNLSNDSKEKYILNIINKVKQENFLNEDYTNIAVSTYLRKIMSRKIILIDEKFETLLKKCGITNNTKGKSVNKVISQFKEKILTDYNVIESSVLETEISIYFNSIQLNLEQIYASFFKNYTDINKKNLIKLLSENIVTLEDMDYYNNLSEKIDEIVNEEYNNCLININEVTKNHYQTLINNLPNTKLDKEIIDIVIEETIEKEIKNLLLNSKKLLISVILETDKKILKYPKLINAELKLLNKNIFTLAKIDFNDIYLKCSREIKDVFKIPSIGYTASTIKEVMKINSKAMYQLIDKLYTNILSKNNILLNDFLNNI